MLKDLLARMYGDRRAILRPRSQVLREAVAAGVNHIDTSVLRPAVTNQIIKQALHPYPKDLVIVTKLGARRGDDQSDSQLFPVRTDRWALMTIFETSAIDALDVVNLRVEDLRSRPRLDRKNR